MPVTTDTPLQARIKERLAKLGLSARGASLAAGLGPDAIRTILDGRSKSPRFETVQALAEVLLCPVGYLSGATSDIGDSGPEARARTIAAVRYEICADRWLGRREFIETPAERWLDTLLPERFGYVEHWLERVSGRSADKYAPPGSYVHVASVVGLPWAAINQKYDIDVGIYMPQHGDLVVMERVLKTGQRERSLREVEIEGPILRFRGCSHDEALNDVITHDPGGQPVGFDPDDLATELWEDLIRLEEDMGSYSAVRGVVVAVYGFPNDKADDLPRPLGEKPPKEIRQRIVRRFEESQREHTKMVDAGEWPQLVRKK